MVGCGCNKCKGNPPISRSELQDLLNHYGDENRTYALRSAGLAPPHNRCSLAGKVYAAAAALLESMPSEAE